MLFRHKSKYNRNGKSGITNTPKFKDFIIDITSLAETGITFNNELFSVKIKGYICDVPARAFILQTKGHSGYYSCFECDIRGSYNERQVSFCNRNFNLRSDESFIDQSQPEHYCGRRNLELIPKLNMILLSDRMHLIYLGIVKKLILLRCSSKPTKGKLSRNQKSLISSALSSIGLNIPSEFNRTPDSLYTSHRWKGTQYRQFILYSGAFWILFKFYMDKTKFLLIFIACVIYVFIQKNMGF